MIVGPGSPGLVGLIVFLVFKFKFGGKCLRKKRANELEDDDYAYTSKEDGKEHPWQLLGTDAICE